MSEYVLAKTLPSPPDLRDIPYVSPFTENELPTSVDMRGDVFEIEDQGPIGSCVANGVASSCELIANRNNQPIDLSRMFLYNATKAYEGRLGEEGLYTRNAYHIAYKYGMPTEEYYPYDLSKDNIDPPIDAYQMASENRITRYENLTPGRVRLYRSQEEKDFITYNIKAALHEGLPVGMAVSVTTDLLNLTGPWQLQNYPWHGDFTNGRDLGGHYMLIVGYDDDCGKFLVQNSWGTDYGDNGYCGLPYAIVGHPFFEAWVARSFKDMNIPEEKGIKLEHQSRYRLTARIVPEEEEIGTTVKIWVGAVDGEGKTFIKQPVESIDDGIPGYSMPDEWLPIEQSGLVPACDNYVLDDDNYINVIRFFDLSIANNVKVYVGYGVDEQSMKLNKIVTL